MTEAELIKLIAGGESMTVEFKGDRKRPLRDGELIEAVVAMANASGGQILVGVEDDGQVTGARAEHQDAEGAAALIMNRTTPNMPVEAEVVEVEGQKVLVVHVPHSDLPVATSTGKCVRRAVGGDGRPCCKPFFHHEILSHQASHGRFDYSAAVVDGASWNDLDTLEFERMRRTIRENPGLGDPVLLSLSDMEAAKALGIIDSESEIRMAALLLFGKQDAIRKFIPSHEAAFQVLEGTIVKVNDFFRWPLLRVMDEIMSRFRARYSEEEFLFGARRIGVPNYAGRSFREAVANALIHRDYQQLGAVHVQWYPDSVSVSNPGGFVEGVRLDNLLVVRPKPRNPLLADAFKRSGLVERTGRGIDTIFEGQVRYGRPVPSYSLSNEAQVTVILHSPPADLGFSRFIIQQESNSEPFSIDALLILNALREEGRLSLRDAAALIQKDKTKARNVLRMLVELDTVDAEVGGRRPAYRLSAQAEKAIVEHVSKIRKEPSVPEAVMQLTREHGGIRRQDVVALLSVGEDQAGYILRKLARQGLLRLVGFGRSAYYVPAAPEGKS